MKVARNGLSIPYWLGGSHNVKECRESYRRSTDGPGMLVPLSDLFGMHLNTCWAILVFAMARKAAVNESGLETTCWIDNGK
jgi:hypothetical protein